MNKETMMRIAIFSLGMSFGSGFTIAMNALERRLSWENDISEVDDMHEFPTTNAQYEDDDEIPVRGTNVAAYRKIAKSYKPDVMPPIKGEENEDDETDEEETEEEMEMAEAEAASLAYHDKYRPPIEPHVIDIESFSEEMEQNDKITIYYYEEDDVLLDNDEEIITDVASVVGNTLGTFTDEPGLNVLYVRNEKLTADFEIIKVRGSYAETVLGIVPEEPPKEVKKRKRRTTKERDVDDE